MARSLLPGLQVPLTGSRLLAATGFCRSSSVTVDWQSSIDASEWPITTSALIRPSTLMLTWTALTEMLVGVTVCSFTVMVAMPRTPTLASTFTPTSRPRPAN
ncbi:hypothetical protein D3C72_2062970 [compost metagenome]